MNQEASCILCGNKETIMLVEHHTIPRCINPGWLKTVPLCMRCHRIIHQYILRDVVQLLKQLKENMLKDYYLFNTELVEDFDYPVQTLHMKVVEVLLSHIPKRHTLIPEKISVQRIARETGISEAETPTKADYQRVGYILKDLKIKSVRENTGKFVHYDEKTIERIKGLERNLNKLIKVKED